MSPEVIPDKPTPVPEGAAAGSLEITLSVMARFQRFAGDIAGLLVLATAGMTFIAMLFPTWTRGVLLAWWSELLWTWFGWGGLWLVPLLVTSGAVLLRGRRLDGRLPVHWGRIFALEIAAFTSLALLAALGGTSLTRADAGLDGGRVGWALSYLLAQALKPLGLAAPLFQVVILSVILLVCLLIGLGVTQSLAAWARRQSEYSLPAEEFDFDNGAAISVAPIQGQEGTGTTDLASRKKRRALPPQFRKQFRMPAEDIPDDKLASISRDDRLPPLELLIDEKATRPDERNINLTAGLIEKTLAEFGIPAKVVGFRVGPTVTQFAVEPGFVEKEKGSTENGEAEIARQKVRVAQISSLSRDLALALSAQRLRIQAPVPGRPYIGIEVPNAKSSVVRLRPILESEAYYRVGAPLAVALGRDVSGQPVVADLGRMPHLLIAGTTGSGKSVCIAALTTCLVMNNTPEELRLVMIDPKMVELVRFNGLPHLYGKVETDLERILGVLRWTVAEMDRRYKLLEASRSRNLDSYNRKARRRKGEEPLPRIVVLLDELADLMMSAPEQTEPALVRLAQMARATGIHLVVATQRPSTDVVTGLIKANFPARISFSVASSIDSRVILDTTGAESLLGRGDMLFMPPEASAPLRSQGVIVTEQEVERVITFWQKAIPGDASEEPPWEELLAQEAILSDRDDLIEKAIEVVRSEQRASASMLQRRLRVGYPRAARLIDELEDLGIIGPSQGGGRERDVLVPPDEGET